MRNRLLGLPPYLRCTGQSTNNFLYNKINDDLIIIFDCQIIAVNQQADSTHFFETIYLVVSDKLNLPYFQTQPESMFGESFLAKHLKTKAGVNDVSFPERPAFSEKYIVDIKLTDAPKIFTAPVFDFYERNNLYRTVGEGKMLALLQWKIEPFDQNQINIQLNLLHTLFDLLKK